MKLTLDDVLKIPSLRNASLIFDKQNESLNDIYVSNIMIMEGHDVENWLEPNEILLTSLIGYKPANAPEFIKLFTKLHELKCPGLVIKLGRYLSNIPPKLKEAALNLNLPLIIVDNDIQYKDILYQITQLLFNESNRQLEIYRNTNQLFVNLMENTTTVSFLIKELSSILHSPVSIVSSIKYGTRSNCPQKENEIMNEFVKYVPENKLFSRRYFIHRFTVNNHEKTEILTKLYTRNEENEFLCVETENNKIDDDQFISIDVATNFIDLQLNIESNIKNINKAKINDSIDSLLNTEHAPSNDLPMILTDHGFVKEKSIILIYCEIQDNNFSTFYDQPNIVSSFIMNFKNLWKSLVYRTWPNRLLIMIQTDDDEGQIKSKIKQIATYVQNLLDRHSKIRISFNKVNYQNLKHGSDDCLNTLRLSSTIFNNHKLFITTKSDLGIYQLLSSANDSDSIKALIPKKLLVLNKKEPELIETLEQYIINLGNLSKSANALFIHPKTMSYRIKKIESKYRINLNNSDELTNISVGIHLLKII